MRPSVRNPVPPRAVHGILALTVALVVASCADAGDDLLTGPASSENRFGQSDAPGLQDFGPAIRAAGRHTPGLMQNPAIVGTAVGLDDDGRPSVHLYLAHGNVQGLPEHLDGVPVTRVVTGLFMLRQDRTARARPAPIGFSVGHPDITAGTIGARVTDGTNVYILSNNHVMANNNSANIGDPILQPGAYDGGSQPGDVIGHLHDFQPISFSSNNQMDAAIALVDGNDVSGSTPTTAGYGSPSSNVVNASIGMSVQKYGRTTGLTFGSVSSTNATVSICFVARGPFMCAQAATFVGQIMITDGSFSAGGDSGSLIVTTNGNDPVGLLFAGSSTHTIANPIGVVLNRFGVTIDASEGGSSPPPPSGPTASFNYTCTELACSFDGSGSSPGDASITEYAWTFGDDNTGLGATVDHSYTSGGSYTVWLTVTDGAGLSDSQSQTVTVAEAPGEGDLSIDQFQVSTRTQGPWRRATVNWSVSHTAAGLSNVTTQLLSGENVLDSASSSVSGSNASGTHDLRSRNGSPDLVRIIVTDASGNQLVQEQSVSF